MEGNTTNGPVRLQGTLRCKAIPSSDYFLFKDIRDTLDLRDMRDVFILGLRWIHAAWYEPRLRLMVLHLAHELRRCDVDFWQKSEQPEHTPLGEIRVAIPDSEI